MRNSVSSKPGIYKSNNAMGAALKQAFAVLRPVAASSVSANARLCVVGVGAGTFELDLRSLVTYPIQSEMQQSPVA